MNLPKINSPDPRLEKEKWQSASQQGKESFTWVSDSWVLQERSASSLAKTEHSIEILSLLRDDPFFKSVRGEILSVEKMSFFSIWPKVEGGHIVYPENNQFPGWEKLKNSLPSMAKRIAKLHGIPLKRKAFIQSRNEIVSASLADQSWVKEGLFLIADNVPILPEEPKTEYATSHGDLGLQNILVKDNQALLIDWATVAALPLHADGAHFTESLIYRLSEDDWEGVIKETNILCPDLEYDEWIAAVIWSACRSLVVWPSTKEAGADFLARVSRFLG